MYIKLSVKDLQSSNQELPSKKMTRKWPAKKTGRLCSCPAGIICRTKTRRSIRCGGAGRKWNCPAAAASRVVRLVQHHGRCPVTANTKWRTGYWNTIRLLPSRKKRAER